jgi:putative tryptophan/tyrosine transport system substrate-binding protein
MKRRAFITLLGSAAAAWPLTASAQQPVKLPTIGFLGTTSQSAWTTWTAAFVRRLSEMGWIEGRTVAIEYRWAEGRTTSFAEIAAEFVRLKVDVILTSGSAGAAAKQATSVIPIVLALATDPLGAGLVASLSRPGGNITGLSQQSPDLAGKRLEILRELATGLRRLAILANIGDPQSVVEIGEVQAAARTFGFETTNLEVNRSEDIALAFEMLKGNADALYVCTGAFMNSNRVSVITFANSSRLKTIYGHRQYVEAGGLMSYGPNIIDMFRRAAEMVDKILRGTKPANIPIEQPTKFDLVINLSTAKALGFDVPRTLLARADEVIE